MAAFPQPKYQRFGRYVLLDRINVGGMAEVFRGKTTGVEGFQKLVAIKRILPNIAEDEDFIEMFIDEAKLAVQLQHANIAQIFDLGQADARYFISMEYVSGVDLRTVWDRARRRNRLLPIAMSCYIIQRVCEGLDYAHRKKDEGGKDIGLVHRDVSPQNVLLSFEGEVKLVDFGIALARHKVSKTQAGILKGKFGYMSPEQVRGVELDHRSDLFACGILLWELLVGDRLFLGESDFSTLEKVRNVEMVPPTHFNKNLSPQVERIVMKALAKNRDDRYKYASEMAEDLQRYLIASDQPFARTDLQRYMAQHFTDEIKQERDRLERYRAVSDEEIEAAVRIDDPSLGRRNGSLANLPTQALPKQESIPPGNIPEALRARPLTFTGALSGTEASALGELAPQMLGRILPRGGNNEPQPTFEQEDSGLQSGRMPTWAKIAIGVVALLSVAGVAALWLVSLVSSSGGSITIEVTPADAEIFLNDTKVASHSPYSAEDLAPGSYVLTVKKAGFKDLVRPVRIQADLADIEHVMLEPTAGTGSLFVRTTPKDLEIWLDGENTSKKTPAGLSQVHAGRHELLLKQDGEIVYQAPLDLAEGAAQAVEVDITRLPPLLEVEATPVGVEIWADGKRMGEAPIALRELKIGGVQLQAKKKGCKTLSQHLELKPAVHRKLRLDLECK